MTAYAQSMTASPPDQLLGLDWRALSLGLRQGGSLLKTLVGTTFAQAIQLPQMHKRRGKTTVAGLNAPVEIIRDRYDVPHCFAESAADALFALGYVQAQDRPLAGRGQYRLGQVAVLSAGPGLGTAADARADHRGGGTRRAA